MTANRTHPQASARPPGDPRRAAALRVYLRRVAEALAPRWASTGRSDDFGAALLEIGARLGEETSRRLDQTAERDAIAFFDFLGLPPTPPQAATGVLVMALAKEVADPVFAPVRSQVAATTIAGDQVTFETQHGVRVVPGRLAELIAVDPTADRIERAPSRVTSLEPPGELPESYGLVTFADTASLTLQVSPAVGLAAEDVLRIGTSAHRIEKFDDTTGIVTLHDPLEAPAPAGTAVSRIASFETFNMRDLQHHAFYIGHDELFDLEQAAQISIGLTPADLARRLTQLDITYSTYGTAEGADEPDWQPLDLVGSSDAEIHLAKTWVGTVDKVEVGGHKSRWLRAELQGPVPSCSSPAAAASHVWLKAVSMDTGSTGSGLTPSEIDGPGSSGLAEGSATIVRAIHNGTPLSTTRRFFPFGPEPLRFDMFAFAAPEALSKKGATVRVSVAMVDSSLVSLEITPATTGASRPGGYGVGSNGDLQILSFDGGDSLRWRELKAVADNGRRLLLTNAAPVGVSGFGDHADVVVVRDRDGDLWSARIRQTSEQAIPSVDSAGWLSLPALSQASSTDPSTTPPNGRPLGPAIMSTPSGLVGMAAILLDVRLGDLYSLALDESGKAIQAEWQRVGFTLAPSPVLVGAWQLTVVQGADWPRRPDGSALEMVAIDLEGAVWLGSATIGLGQRLTVNWRRFDDTGKGADYQASPDVSPAATRFHRSPGPAQLLVAYARPDDPEDQYRKLHGLIHVDGVTTHVPVGDDPDAKVGLGTGLHANPTVVGGGGYPVTAGLGPDRKKAVFWYGARKVLAANVSEGVTTSRPLLLPTGVNGAPELILGGTAERLFRAAFDLIKRFKLHNLLQLESKEVAHAVEIIDPSGARADSKLVELSADNRRIVQEDLRVYEYDPPLPKGSTLNFLRLDPVKDPSYTGSFDDFKKPKELRLDAKDTQKTKAGMWLIIGGASYRVTTVSNDRVATLEHPVPGINPPLAYRPARLLATETVEAADLDTLVELNNDAIIDPPSLDFGLGADPATQELTLQQKGGGSVWARLDQEWISRPPDGWVAVPGSPKAPTWSESSLERGYQNPELSWEYFDGKGWRRLESDFLDSTNNLSTSGKVQFIVPDDLSTTEIGGQEDYWIRARLIGGDYGRPKYVVQTEPTSDDNVNKQTVTVDTSSLRPPEILGMEAKFVLDDQTAPKILLVDNNLDVLDQTQAASAASAARFELFQGASSIDVDTAERAVFLGFTAPIDRGSLYLFVDAADQDGAESLRVDVRVADGWRPVSVDDRTESLRRRGTVVVTLDVSLGMVRLFGQDRIWLRLRPAARASTSTSTGPSGGSGVWAPVVHGLYCNAVEISHAKTIEDEILGSSLGEPGMTVAVAETPVLPDTVQLRVRERLSDEELAALVAQYATAARPPHEPSEQVVRSDLERIPGSWVLWRRVDSFIGYNGDDRVYLLDPSSGQVTFGDTRRGKVPPAGRDGIRAFSYQQGGGEAGNVPAWPQAKLTSAVEGVDTVVLPVDTVGGFSAPETDSLFATAPERLRHAGKALTPADVEALAVTSSSAIVRARCARPTGPGEPMTVTIAVRDGSRCPVPTLAQRDAVAAFIRMVGWGGLGEGSIQVKGPTYMRLAVTADLVAAPDRQSDVENTAKAILVALFHPIDGGPSGSGWPFGRRPSSSDLLRALSDIHGLDQVDATSVAALGDRSLDELPADGLVCAEATDIAVVVTCVEGTS